MFLWYDYLILIATLLISILIGIYFGCTARKATTTEEYLSGGKRMSVLPIAISVTVGHFSTITLVAVPADVYKYGAYFFFTASSAILFVLFSIFLYYPVLYKTKVSSSFEYLEKRFDHKSKMLGSVFYVIYENLLLPVIAFTPALAVAVVTGAPVQLIALLICGICIFYTAIGGLRTVIWTDLVQFLIIIVSFLIFCIIGVKSVGGLGIVWETALRGGRLDIFDFDLDPTKKDSFWICVIGLGTRFLYYICLSQSSVQKYLSLPTLKACIRSIIISGISWFLVMSCSVLFGLILYTNYVNCDPVLDGKITRIDQIVPYYVEQVAENIPGLSGLFMAALISAGISTLSSSLNALSGVIYNDFIVKIQKKNIKENTKVAILKVIVIVEGLICTALVFIVPYLGEILPMAIGLTGIIDGPSLGLFTLGVGFSKITSNDAFYGSIGGLLIMILIYFPSIYYQNQRPEAFPGKYLSNNGCTTFNSTFEFFNTSSLSKQIKENVPVEFKPFFLFRISPNYYCFIGTVSTILLGLLIQFIRNKIIKYSNSKPKENQNKVDRQEMHPFIK